MSGRVSLAASLLPELAQPPSGVSRAREPFRPEVLQKMNWLLLLLLLQGEPESDSSGGDPSPSEGPWTEHSSSSRVALVIGGEHPSPDIPPSSCADWSESDPVPSLGTSHI
jgi:hypothetical protein